MSPGTHIKLLLNRLCICTQTEEKEHSQTPTAPLLLPHLLPSPFSFTPLMLRAQRRSKRDGQTMEMWMRAHLVSCPPLSSDEVAQFMFVLYKLCLPQVISVTSDGLRSFLPMDCPLFKSHAESKPTVQERLSGHLEVLDLFAKLLQIPPLLTSPAAGKY